MLLRNISILEMIPRAPDGISVREIISRLEESEVNFKPKDSKQKAAQIRNTQRALLGLSEQFPISFRENGKEYLWFWLETAPGLFLPSFDISTALVLTLAKQYLEPILPPSILQELSKFFRMAEDRLAEAHKTHSAKGASAWQDKVAQSPSGLLRMLPQINSKVESAVYDALLTEKAIKVRYRAWKSSVDQEYVISPVGLVVRNQLIYVVSKDHGDKKLRHRLLHRFQTVEPTSESFLKEDGFKAQKYVDEGHFGFKLDRQESKIQLQLRMDDLPLTGVRECPISRDQKILPVGEGKFLLTANVDNTLELQQWLRSHAHHVEVLAPKWLREEFAESAHALLSLYSS